MFFRIFPRRTAASNAAKASVLGMGAGRDLFAVETLEPRILLSAAPIDAPVTVSDVSALPDTAFGHRSLMWWGTMGLMVIEGTVFGLAIAMYFYLRLRVP